MFGQLINFSYAGALNISLWNAVTNLLFSLGNVLGSPIVTFSQTLPRKIAKDRLCSLWVAGGTAAIYEEVPVTGTGRDGHAVFRCVSGRAPRATAGRGEHQVTSSSAVMSSCCPALLSLQIQPQQCFLSLHFMLVLNYFFLLLFSNRIILFHPTPLHCYILSFRAFFLSSDPLAAGSSTSCTE